MAYNLKTTKVLDCALIGVSAEIGSNTVIETRSILIFNDIERRNNQ